MKQPNPPWPVASNSVTKTMVLSSTTRGPSFGLNELRPLLTETCHDAVGGPPFLPMPKKALALELLKVYFPGPRPPAATAAAARASEPVKTIAKTITRRRRNISFDSDAKRLDPPAEREPAWLDFAGDHLPAEIPSGGSNAAARALVTGAS